MESVRRRRV
jgi:hypothetical protein